MIENITTPMMERYVELRDRIERLTQARTCISNEIRRASLEMEAVVERTKPQHKSKP